MTTRAADASSTFRRFVRIVSSARRRALGAIVLGVLAAASGLFIAALLLPPSAWRSPGSPAPIAGLFVLLGVVAAGATMVGWAMEAIRPERLAREVEGAVGLGDGEFAGALELGGVIEGASPDLAEHQRRRVAGRIEGRAGIELLPLTLRRWRRGMRLAAAAALVTVTTAAVLGAGDPARARGAVRAIASPWAVSFPPPPPRPRIERADTLVERGTEARIRIGAPGRRDVSLRWRGSEGALKTRWLPVDPASATANGSLGPVLSPTAVWAEDRMGASSDTLLVRPFDPPFVTRLEVTVRFPAYLGRRPESHARPLPAFEIPAGSRMEIRGETNRPLSRLGLREEETGRRTDLRVADRSFEGALVPRASGDWSWLVEERAGDPPARAPRPLHVSVLEDRDPTVTIVYPAADTVLPLDMLLPLVIDARDDNGLHSVDLVSWRRPASGVATEPVVESLVSAASEEDRMLLRPLLDLRARGLIPGDTILYFARARDERPNGPIARSDTFAVRLPSLGELGGRRALRTADLAEEAAAAAEAARTVQRGARRAGRRARARGDPTGIEEERGDGGESARSSFGATEDSRRVLEEARKLEERIATLHEEIEELAADVERSPAADPALRRQLDRIESLYRELLDSDLAARIEELQRALQSLDPSELRRALEALSTRTEAVSNSLEAAGALLERIATEQAMHEAARRAEDLAAEQRALSEAFEAEPEWAGREEGLARRAARLEGELADLIERLRANDGPEAAEAVTEGAEHLGNGREGAERAADLAGSESEGQGAERAGSAEKSARGATIEMNRAADRLSAANDGLSREWKEEVGAAVARATREALALAREQGQVADLLGGDTPPAARGRQMAVRQGLANLLGSLADAGRKTALMDRRVGRTAAKAADDMDRLLESLGSSAGGGSGPASEGRALANVLNDLARELMATEDAVASAESGTGVEAALEELSRLSRAQGGLSREGGGLLALRREGREIGARLRRLASEQSAIAARLGELARMPGSSGLTAKPEALAREAAEIARELEERGPDAKTVERQERLFRRLLDAGRTLRREDEDPARRESVSARAGPRLEVPDLDPSLREGARFPHPDESTLRGFSPAMRRIVLDYFDRLNERNGPAVREEQR